MGYFYPQVERCQYDFISVNGMQKFVYFCWVFFYSREGVYYIDWMYQDEQEIEYLDYIKPKRNRKKRDEKVRLEELDQYEQSQRQCFKDEQRPCENKDQHRNSEFLTFQPDNTMNQYEHQLTYIQEQPEIVSRKDRPSRPRKIDKHRGSSQKEGGQEIKKEECLVSALSTSIYKIDIEGKHSKRSSFFNRLQTKYFKSLVTMQQSSFSEAKADILFIPFLSSHLELYPGSILQDRLLAQRSKLATVDIQLGGIYMKGNHQAVEHFRFLVFLKTDLNEIWRHLALGFNSIIAKIKKDSLSIATLAFFVDAKNISVSEILKGIATSSLKKLDNPLQFQILTTDETVFREESQHFQQFASRYSK